jgi:class 3 adenylate cyclase
VVISPQTSAKSAEIKRRHNLEFPVLVDSGNNYARKFSIVFTLPEDIQNVYKNFDIRLPDFNGDDSWELPMPTRIVVDRDGIMRDIEADPDYTHRPDPEATIEVLEEKIKSTSKRLLHSLRVQLEAERRRSEELLLNILPAPIAAELKREGRVKPVHVDAATVLFTDFEGFTAAAAQMSARDIVGKLNECFTAFDEIVQKHGLEKLKTIGDAYMAAGGVLGDGEDHTPRMVKAAAEMRDWIQNWSGSCEVCGERGWGVRIGIHRGPLVAGVIGSRKFAYDVWGDTVNVAARLETAGATGRINVSQEVVDALGGEYEVEERGVIVMKNRGEIEMFFVEPKEEKS